MGVLYQHLNHKNHNIKLFFYFSCRDILHLVLKEQLNSFNWCRAGLWYGGRATRDQEVLRESQSLRFWAPFPASGHLFSLKVYLADASVTGFSSQKMALDRGLAELCYSSALQGCLCLTEPRFRHRTLRSPPVPEKSPEASQWSQLAAIKPIQLSSHRRPAIAQLVKAKKRSIAACVPIIIITAMLSSILCFTFPWPSSFSSSQKNRGHHVIHNHDHGYMIFILLFWKNVVGQVKSGHGCEGIAQPQVVNASN